MTRSWQVRLATSWVAVVAAVLPGRVKRTVYVHAFGWAVDPSATIGISVVMGRRVNLGPQTHIGHFNVFRNLESLTLERGAYIKNFNTFTAPGNNIDGQRALRLEPDAHVMSHHYFDVSGSIEIGENAIVGGRDTQMWTHSRFRGPTGELSLESRALVVGADVYVGARVVLVHCVVAPGCVVGAGAVVTRSFGESDWFIGGNPAKPIKYLGARRQV